jgi:ABC-type molybdate transport system permease subunit
LIAPGVVAGAMLAFTLSLDDFIITFFTTGPGATTLPIYVYGLATAHRHAGSERFLDDLDCGGAFLPLGISQWLSEPAIEDSTRVTQFYISIICFHEERL